jgi:hypothetical protein
VHVVTIKVRRRPREFDVYGQEVLLETTPEGDVGIPETRETSQSKAFDTKTFWRLASERCSQLELVILAARAADERWETIAEAQGITVRHANRLAAQAAGRITGVRPPFNVKPDKVAVTYAIQATNGGHIKIGQATDGKVDKRLQSLNIGHPERLVLLALLDRTEVDAHYDLRKYRYRGEWYTDAPEVLAYIDTYRIEAQDAE